MDKQIRIDRCRELLNELGHLGIQPEQMKVASGELKDSIASFAEIERQMDEASTKYRSLKKLEHDLTLAVNPRFTHGPLFDEQAEPQIERTLVDYINQLRPEDRADEEKRRYDLGRNDYILGF